MNIQFTQITEYLKYPPMLKSKLSELHRDIVMWGIDNFDGTYSQRKRIVNVMNAISYYLITGDAVPSDWSASDPLVNALSVDDDECKSKLGDLYLSEKGINWDIEISKPLAPNANKSKPKITSTRSIEHQPKSAKEDLYIQPPRVPRFDKSNIWASYTTDADNFVIYSSLPEIPRVQNEISITTDINKMTKGDIMKLFPDTFIQTRSPVMYTNTAGKFHPELGAVLEIQGYTEDQLIDNLIKYPHLYKLQKQVDGSLDNFYSTIEIGGNLYDIFDVWEELPESKYIPQTPDYMKEYVTRRYLLERDIDNIDHKYKMFGTLEPFLTLFAPQEFYQKMGYDALDVATQCVKSRVSYKQSRNPILRRIASDA